MGNYKTTLRTFELKSETRFEKQPETQSKRGLLLTYVGEATNDIFNTLPETGDDYDTAVAKLTTYFEPTSNTDMAILEFREMKQERGETLNAFYPRLKQGAIKHGRGNG